MTAYHNAMITRLRWIQNFLAHAVIKASTSCHYQSDLTLYSLAQNNRTHQVQIPLTDLQSRHKHPTSNLYNIISVQPRSTRSSSVVTLAQPPTSSPLRITDRSF